MDLESASVTSVRSLLYSALLEWNRATLRRNSKGKCLYRFFGVRINGTHESLRFEAASRRRKIFDFTSKIQAFLLVMPIDADEVSRMDLLRSKEVGERIDDITLQCQLEALSAKALLGSF
jgi:hypothetical protein